MIDKQLEEEIRTRHFQYCPICGADMKLRLHDDTERPVCTKCGFVHYLNPAPAAGAVVFDNGRLLMVMRAREPYVGKWTIPAGFVEWGEDPEDTAVRELKEETGLDVKTGQLFHVYAGSDDPRTRALLILYFADVEAGKLQAGDDAAEADWFALDDLPTDDEIAFESHRRALAKLKKEFPDKFRQ